jgi:hypothetical protein
MRPEWMGAARLTRYSFNRMMIRRAFDRGWTAEVVSFDLDAEGRGEAVIRIEAEGRVFHFVAFTTTIDESHHTDRVIADRWEVTATLSEGDLTGDLLAMLRTQVPQQERGRLDHRVLVLTRGNRSVRFFQYLVDSLAAGRQPDPDLVADSGYIMRSTAFYGNGKFGMRSFEGYDAGHPLGAPFRAQMLCAWLFRELSYLVVEHCARAKGGDTAVGFATGWDRYFGLGNATGLGLIPFAFKHPAIIDAWCRIREQALAEVRSMVVTDERRACLRWWIDRARRHFVGGTDDDCRPFLNGAALGPVVDEVADRFEQLRHDTATFDRLYRWAEDENPETAELVVSMLIELHDGDDLQVDAEYVVDEGANVLADRASTVADLKDLLAKRQWLDGLDLDDPETDWYWWLISDNSDEPRRAPRRRLEPRHRDVAVDVAVRLARLGRALRQWPDHTDVEVFLGAEPDHRLAVHRLAGQWAYGEPHDNACARSYLPLMLQRFQLATYGMDNFKPKSTDWLRVTLFQGAPRIGDLSDLGGPTGARHRDATGAADRSAVDIDRWPWPERPAAKVTAHDARRSSQWH